MNDAPSDAFRWKTAPGPGRTDPTALVRCATYALNRFRELGIPFPTPNRLERAMAVVDDLRTPSIAEPDPARLRDAIRTIYDCYYIARACGGDAGRVEPELRDRLGQLMAGPDLVIEEDENSSRARNTQFELLLGAWFTCGGTPVRLAEPDVRVVIGAEELGVAAKRIRSRKQIRKRVRKAVDQILKSPGRGFPALCVDGLLDDLDQLGDPEELGCQFDRSFPEFEAEITRLETEPRIYGLLVMGTRAGWVAGTSPRRLDIGNFVKFRALVRTAAEQAVHDAFWAEFWKSHETRMQTF